MIVTVECQLRPIKPGYEAYSRPLRLAGHGKTEEQAMESLQQGIVALCRPLERRGELDAVLTDKGVPWERHDGPVEVIVVRPGTMVRESSEP